MVFWTGVLGSNRRTGEKCNLKIHLGPYNQQMVHCRGWVDGGVIFSDRCLARLGQVVAEMSCRYTFISGQPPVTFRPLAILLLPAVPAYPPPSTSDCQPSTSRLPRLLPLGTLALYHTSTITPIQSIRSIQSIQPTTLHPLPSHPRHRHSLTRQTLNHPKPPSLAF